MTNNRKIKVPFYPYVLLLISLILIVAAGAFYINYPSQTIVFNYVLGVGLFFAVVAFACRPVLFKEIFATRKTVLWLNDIILIFAIIGIGVLISHIAFRRNLRYDFTRNKIFSLSDLTIKTIKELDKEVKIYGFFPKNGNEEGVMIDLFKEYKRLNDKLTWVMIDPQIDPVTSQKMNVAVMGTVIVECGSNRQTVLPDDLFFIPNRMLGVDDTPKFTGEQAITSAIVNVLSGTKRVISVVNGHEEPSIKGFKANDIAALHQLLTQENYEVVECNLLTGDIDERTNLLLIVSPKKDFCEAELSKLRSYIETKKGNILFTFDPNPNLKQLYDFVFKEYSVAVNYDIVVDVRGIARNYWTVSPELSAHEITKPLISKNLIGLMFYVCSLTKESNENVKHNSLLTTIQNSWAKRGLENKAQIENIACDKSIDVMGPLDIGIIAEKTSVASGSKALILGDSDFMGNTYISASGNRDLIINSINWLAGNTKMISIRPRIMEMPRIQFEAEDSNKIFTVCVFGVPFLIVFLGIAVFLYRRRVR